MAHGAGTRGSRGMYKGESSDTAASTAAPRPASQVTSLLSCVVACRCIVCSKQLAQGQTGTLSWDGDTGCMSANSVPQLGSTVSAAFLLTYKPPKLKVLGACGKEHIGFDRLLLRPGAETWLSNFSYRKVLIRRVLLLFQGCVLRVCNKCLHTL